MEFHELETDRVWLKEIDGKYAADYFSIMSDDRVTKYYGMDRLETQKQAMELIEFFHRGFHEKRSIRWGLICKDSRKFIGTIGLNNLNLKGKKAEVGYELHPDFWGRGIAREAVQAILEFSFQQLGLNRVGAVTFPENKPSYSLLEKVGFKREGTLRSYLYQAGSSHDAYVFSILKNEWNNSIM